MLSEWESTCLLPQSEEVGSVSVWYRRPPQISEIATRENRRDLSLKIEMRLKLTSKNRTRP